jgi:hypothetical protein
MHVFNLIVAATTTIGTHERGAKIQYENGKRLYNL